MMIIFSLFIFSLLLGQLGGVTVVPGVTVYIHDLVLVVLLCAGIITSRRKKIHMPSLLLPIGVFIFVGILSLLLNVFRFGWNAIGISSLYLVRWALYAALYILVAQGNIPSATIFRWLFYFGTGISIAGLVQFVWYPQLQNLSYLGWDPHYYRLFSTLFDPNFTGLIIVLTILLGISLMYKNASRWLYMLLVLNTVALYLTYSRSSWASCVVGVSLWLIWMKKWRIILILAALVTLLLLLPTPGGKTLRLLRTESVFSRLSNWSETIALIRKSPVIGYGFNTLRYVHNDRTLYQTEIPVSRSASGVDSSILFLLATTGGIGFVSYGWIIYRSLSGHITPLYVCVLAALGFHSLFTNSFFYPWVMIWFWIFAGARENITSDT